jgi:hypothetical protein
MKKSIIKPNRFQFQIKNANESPLSTEKNDCNQGFEAQPGTKNAFSDRKQSLQVLEILQFDC